jgi:hypothetical protein
MKRIQIDSTVDEAGRTTTQTGPGKLLITHQIQQQFSAQRANPVGRVVPVRRKNFVFAESVEVFNEVPLRRPGVDSWELICHQTSGFLVKPESLSWISRVILLLEIKLQYYLLLHKTIDNPHYLELRYATLHLS